MNKQELIEKYESLKGIWNNPGSIPALECFLRDLYQLSEPKKVVIPRFVAEWVEECKTDDMQSLSSALSVSAPEDVSNWLALDDCKNEDLFAKAWLYGYEVEKEKRYWVRDKNGRSMLYRINSNEVRRSTDSSLEIQLHSPEKYTFAEKEIKDYDERYWAFAEEVK